MNHIYKGEQKNLTQVFKLMKEALAKSKENDLNEIDTLILLLNNTNSSLQITKNNFNVDEELVESINELRQLLINGSKEEIDKAICQFLENDLIEELTKSEEDKDKLEENSIEIVTNKKLDLKENEHHQLFLEPEDYKDKLFVSVKGPHECLGEIDSKREFREMYGITNTDIMISNAIDAINSRPLTKKLKK